MQLNLKNPLVFFDLETTGINISTDRIVEISYLKVYPDGREEAKTMRDQYEASISNAKDEARQIISDAQKSATERGEAIVADAKKEAVAIKEKASADIAKERTAAFQQMKSEIGDIAVSIAGKVIEKEVKEADHQKLIDEFISDVGEAS